MEQVWLTILGATLAFMSAVILYILKRNEDRAVKREEKRQALEAQKEVERDEREILILECLNANFSITKELTDCVLYKKPPNGELEEAFKYKQDVKHKMEDYMRRRASK